MTISPYDNSNIIHMIKTFITGNVLLGGSIFANIIVGIFNQANMQFLLAAIMTVVTFATGFWLKWRKDKRDQIEHENEERRKNDLHKLELLRIQNEIDDE